MIDAIAPALLNLATYVSENGAFRPNPLLAHATPYWLVIDEATGDSVVTLAGNGVAEVQMSNDESGIIFLNSLYAEATSSDFTIRILDKSTNRYLCSSEVHGDNIIGDSGRPYKLDFPLILNRSKGLRCELTDLSGVGNTIRLVFRGYKFHGYDEIIEIFNGLSPINEYCRPYIYATDSIVTIAGATEHSAYVSIDPVKDFFLHRVTMKCDGTFKYKILETSGRAWQNGFVPSSVIGSSEYNSHEVPMFIPRDTRLKISMYDMAAAGDVYIALAGISCAVPR